MTTMTLPSRNGHDQVVDLDADGRDYELTVRLTVELDQTHVPGETGQIGGEYLLMAGRDGGVWRLRVHERVSDDVMTERGPALVELHGQREGPDPLSLLRALLTGGGV